jgi:hypothetical protein
MYRKNVASQFVCFQMLLTATGAVATGLSPAVRRCIDGTFAAGGGTVTEDGTTGSYKYAMSQADTNGNDISFIFSAATAMPVCVNIVTTACDPTTATNFGITGIPAVASGSAGALIISGTGTAALSVSSGLVTLAGVTHSGAVIPTVTTVTNQLTAAQVATGIWQDTTAGDFTTASSIGKSLYTSGNAPGAASGIALVGSNMGTITGALTAAQIATGVWTDTTAGDFTTALSVGKSVMNGVSLGTGLTVNDITTKTGYSLSSSQTFNNTGTWTGNIVGTVSTLTTYTGNTVQTGDAYARLGAPAGASVSVDVAAVKTDTAAVKVQTDKLTFTVANKVDANVLNLNGDATSAANIAKTTRAIGRATASGVPTTTSIPTSACTPAGAVADQFKGRIITFDADTTSTALRGQATDITASTNAATPTFTVTALTTAPASGDTFSIT